MLSRYANYPCRSCGIPLGVEQSGTGWFLVGWLPFSISGLFPIPIKFLLGVIGIGLMVFPHVYSIPLVSKPEASGQRLQSWFLPWLAVVFVGVFASDWINMLPTQGTKIASFFVAALLSIPVINGFRKLVPKPEEKMLAFVAGSVLILGMHYFALSVLPVSILAIISGDQQVVEGKVEGKRHSNKLTRCSSKIDLVLTGETQKHEICIPEDHWKSLKNGDRIKVSMLNTAYGRLVTAVEPGGINSIDESGGR